jgi:ferrochelatase
VLLLNLGTPDSHSVRDVRRYLKEFLSDRCVIRLPQRWAWATPLLGSLIARFRAPASAEAYKKIWTEDGSPLKVITEAQSRALHAELPAGWRVYYAMRYANPAIKDVLVQIVADKITDLIVIPMYPQWAGPTTGTACEVLHKELATQGPRLNLTVRSEWYDDARYIEAQASLLHQFATERSLYPQNGFLLFSTHSMPECYIKQGDPYEGQVRRTVQLVAQRLGWQQSRLALSFQSKLGPVKWLSPSTEESLIQLAEAGERDVIVCPISFTTDCLETIEEIGIRYKEKFETWQPLSGTRRLHLVPALNAHPMFIAALRNLVHRPPERLSLDDDVREPLLTTSPEPAANRNKLKERLVCLGYELKGPTPPQSPPCQGDGGLSASDFARIKLPQRESVCLLADLKTTENLASAWILNTCQRLEFYLLVQEQDSLESVAESVCQRLGETYHLIPTLRLRGNAWRHLLYVAAGLQSSLPGDADVLLQLGAAEKMAEHAGTLDSSGRYLLRESKRVVEQATKKHSWGRYRVSFGEVAIPSLLDWEEIRRGRIVVIGGSSTSRSLLRSMVQQHGIAPGQITVVYRGEARQGLVRELRQLLGDSPRIRIDRYDDSTVLEAIARATHVFIATDGREPFLRRSDLENLRNFEQQPISILDFNLHGSTVDVEQIAGVRLISSVQIDQAVAHYAQELRGNITFLETRKAMEEALDSLVGRASECSTESDASLFVDRLDCQANLNEETVPC